MSVGEQIATIELSAKQFRELLQRQSGALTVDEGKNILHLIELLAGAVKEMHERRPFDAATVADEVFGDFIKR